MYQCRLGECLMVGAAYEVTSPIVLGSFICSQGSSNETCQTCRTCQTVNHGVTPPPSLVLSHRCWFRESSVATKHYQQSINQSIMVMCHVEVSVPEFKFNRHRLSCLACLSYLSYLSNLSSFPRLSNLSNLCTSNLPLLPVKSV